MEETQTTVPTVAVPKFAKVLMIIFLVIGGIITLLGLLERNFSDTVPIILWLIIFPAFILKGIMRKTVQGYRAAGISSCIVLLVGFGQIATTFGNSLLEGIAVVFILIWIIVIVNINKAFTKSFPGKKLLSSS